MRSTVKGPASVQHALVGLQYSVEPAVAGDERHLVGTGADIGEVTLGEDGMITEQRRRVGRDELGTHEVVHLDLEAAAVAQHVLSRTKDRLDPALVERERTLVLLDGDAPDTQRGIDELHHLILSFLASAHRLAIVLQLWAQSPGGPPAPLPAGIE